MIRYWFGSRIFDRNIDIEPCKEKIHGPYNSYDDAKHEKKSNNSTDMQQTPIVQALSENEAKQQLTKENWTKF